MRESENPVDAPSLTAALKAEAHRLGFELVGACAAVPSPGFEELAGWVGAGYAGEMGYFARRLDAYRHPQGVLPGCRSLLMLGASYLGVKPQLPEAGQGRIARYAWGADYHTVLRERLHVLADLHRQLVPESHARGVVDTAPLMERQFAALAGLGWIGKNTLLLNRKMGSWFFLAALLTTEELEYDRPMLANHCGTCRRCLDACPTGALVAPHQIDARRCISYLTIEARGVAAAELRVTSGDWVFGCDVCQEVCPWNRKALHGTSACLEPVPHRNPADLLAWFEGGGEWLDEAMADSPLGRARRAGLLRNAAIALGNRPHSPALPALIAALADDDPTVRASVAWALGRYEQPAARAALVARFEIETDAVAREELAAALGY